MIKLIYFQQRLMKSVLDIIETIEEYTYGL